MGKIFWIGIVVSLLLVTAVVSAGSPETLATANLEVKANIPAMIVIDLDAEELVFTNEMILAAMADEEDGQFYVDHDTPLTVNVKGNIGYHLEISAEGEDLLDGAQGIPMDRLSWRHEQELSSSWTDLSIEDELVLTQNTAGTIKQYELDFRLLVDITDPIGEYEGTLVFTLSALD